MTITLDRPATVRAPLPFEPSRRRTFGSHSEMAHTWASCTVEEGRSADGRMLFRNGTIYSYGDHFPIARFLPFTVDGRRVVLFTQDRRSISTAKHISYTWGALSGLDATVISVPDLSTWNGSPDQVAAVWESLVRGMAGWAGEATQYGAQNDARRKVDAFIALYAPSAVMPSDPRAWVAKRDAEIADAKQVARLSDALRTVEADCVDIVRTVYTSNENHRFSEDRSLATADLSILDGRAYNLPSDAIETRLKRVRSALTILRKFPEHADAAKAASAYVKAWTASRDAWRVVEEAAKLERERAERTAAVQSCIKSHRTGTPTWREEGEFLRGLLDDACRLGTFSAEDIAILARAVSLECAEEEFTTEAERQAHYTAQYTRRKPVTADQWRDGAGPVGWSHGSVSLAETMVRRKGDRLETSRGAVVPFQQAVTVYRAASLVRRGVGPGDAIGSRVGHYRLDAIAADGSITVGCHRIAFDEMERLAVREVPHLVKARFPVPALI